MNKLDDKENQYGSLASSATAARGQQYSVDRTLDSVGYEAVDGLQKRNSSSIRKIGAVATTSDLDGERNFQTGQGNATTPSRARKLDDDSQQFSKSFQNRLLSTVRDDNLDEQSTVKE